MPTILVGVYIPGCITAIVTSRTAPPVIPESDLTTESNLPLKEAMVPLAIITSVEQSTSSIDSRAVDGGSNQEDDQNASVVDYLSAGEEHNETIEDEQISFDDDVYSSDGEGSRIAEIPNAKTNEQN